ncbi:polyphosphate polymerase domain-containing protein [Sporosarcina sp.]|uniref:polyphosphate polymerase domain-containing protein n=1 Tax=Sporosarcina sp. TaxID=49982 RepID=UPI002617BDFA|nr:polyphosphate polymerase domain-containing protein [Sporosarcina sp.]
MPIEVFKRYELKYLISWDDYLAFSKELLPNMAYDTYGSSTGTYNIISLYYESKDKSIYHETLNKLPFRQKLRLRVYDQADLSSNSFIEVKQKFKNVVNKRRTVIPLNEAYSILSNPYDEWLTDQTPASNPQILHEALHFKDFYNLQPANIVSYDRQAFSGIAKNEQDLRVTFDYNLMCRSNDLALENGPYGERFLEQNFVILEVKVSNSVPFWLSRLISEFNFTQQGFSKFCTSIDLLEEMKQLRPILRSEVFS